MDTKIDSDWVTVEAPNELPAAYHQPKLSSDVSCIQSYYDVIVIGSGYGGSIAANRLSRSAKKGLDGSWVPLSIAVLERGKEWSTGSFPDTPTSVLSEVQLKKNGKVNLSIGESDSLYEVVSGDDITVLKGCGLGGTSLINANVSLEALPEVFNQPVWPEELRGEGVLEEFYQRARHVLCPEEHPVDRDKYSALKRTAAGMLQNFDFDFDVKSSIQDIEDIDGLIKVAQDIRLVRKLPINVNNEDMKDGNKFGVPQQKCNACGNCMSGCNVGAKNTCMMNYLPDARARGVEMFTSIFVKYIKQDPNGGYFVYYTVKQGSFEQHDMFVRASAVVVSGGSLGSTELLLQSRLQGSLDLSDKLGSAFTGNGDAIGFAYKCKTSVNGVGDESHNVQKPHRAPGPCITGIVDVRKLGKAKKDFKQGFLFEDGTLPGAAQSQLFPMMMLSSILSPDVRSPKDFLRRFGRDYMDNTLIYLCMSHDDAGGVLSLTDDKKGMSIVWPNVGKQQQFEVNFQAMVAGAVALDAKAVRNPVWTKELGNQLVTVHPLGGCPMGSDSTLGVVNHKGQVFYPKAGAAAVHRGLYVMDGSVVPTSLGVNPLLTISAISERSVQHMVADHGWRPIDFGFQGAKNRELFKKGSFMAVTTPGLMFSERMAGYLVNADAMNSEMKSRNWIRPFVEYWQDAQSAPSQQKVQAEFTLTISTDNVDVMVSDKDHSATMCGVFICPLLSAHPMTVRNGKFQLFPNSDYERLTKEMIYSFFADSEEGKMYYVRGMKFVKKNHWWELGIKAETTLYVSVHEVKDQTKMPPGPIAAAGVLTIALGDLMKQLGTMHITNCRDPQIRIPKLAKFFEYFADSTLEVYCPIVRFIDHLGLSAQQLKTQEVNYVVARRKRPLKLGNVVPEVFALPIGDTAEVTDKKNNKQTVPVQLRLTRFRGGTKGPLLLIHGYGVSSAMFTVDTIDTNLVEYLVAKEYDVWLLDWRTSIALPWLHATWDLDRVAQFDHPAAVNKVLELTGAKDLQVICHCVGSVTFCMSLLGGFIERTLVRTVVVSQVAFDCIPHTAFEKTASILNFPAFIEKCGMDGFDVNSNWSDSAGQIALQAVGNLVGAMRTLPVGGEGCDSKVCHRITFLYGLLWCHKNFNQATHDALQELFGFANGGGLAQLSRCIVNVNPICDVSQEKNPKKPMYNQLHNLTMPIRFISGVNNYCFDPMSTAHSAAAAQAVQPLSDRVVIPGYGHIDVFMGQNAANDCFDTFESFLSANTDFKLTQEAANAVDKKVFQFTKDSGCQCSIL